MTRRTANFCDDPTRLRGAIVATLERQRKPITITRLASLLRIHETDPGFLDAMFSLRREGLIYASHGDRYASATGMFARVGRISTNGRGYGFVRPDDGGEEIYVPAKSVEDALDGDRVLVAPSRRRGREGLHTGRVLGVVERTPRPVVGTFRRGADFAWVHPDDEALPDIYLREILDDALARARDGDKVVAELEPITLTSTFPAARLIKVLGKPNDPWTDINGIIYQFGLHEGYPADAEREAASAPTEIAQAEIRSRRDLRGWEIVTIDPADAADLDDAVSLTLDEKGRPVVGVHIADVSHYVAMNGKIDGEAAARGTSVYLPGKVLHMLPRALSEKACSLQPGDDLLTMSVLVTLDDALEPIGAEISRTVIRSRAKLSYEEVQAVLDGKGDENNPAGPHGKMLRELAKIAERFAHRRMMNGALDFDVPEVKVKVDEEGHTRSIEKRERLASHRLIEELMLLANRTVAHHLAEHHYELLYRVHAGPDPQKLREVVPLAAAAGHTISPEGKAPTVKELQALLHDVAGEPVAPILETLIIRSLPKAVYQPDNIGHFGLATDEYTHFTSPIRRYPDLIVHRQLGAMLEGKPSCYTHDQLVAIGHAASQAEQTAERAEREAIRAKQVEYLAEHLGEVFAGTISGVRKFGLFVMLDDSLAEGLVSIDDLDDDYYRFDASAMCLAGRRSRRTYRFGDPVSVQVARVDTVSRRVDFILADAPRARRKGGLDAESGRKGPSGASRGRRGTTRSHRASRTAGRGRKGRRRRS